MAVPDGAILRVVASFLFPESVIAQNVFYAIFNDTGGSDDEDDVVSDVIDWLEGAYTEVITAISDEVDTTTVHVYLYDAVDDDWDEVGSAPWSVNFNNTADMMPHGCAMIAHCQTTDPDVRGTKYVGGPGDGAADASNLSGPIITLMLNYADEWIAPFVGAATGGDFGPGIWSVKNTAFFLCNGVDSVNTDIGYQRRRKPGVGI